VTDGFDAVAARLAQDLRRDCRQMATVMLADPTIAPLRMSMLLLLARLADGAVPTIKETQLSPWSSLTQRPPVVEPKASRSPASSSASAWRYTTS
jgi:hypothetical protein